MQAVLKNIVTDRMNAAADNRLSVHDPDQRAELVNLYALGSVLMHAQTILFPAEQAGVFAELSHRYSDTLDYALPFDQVLIEFMAPVTVGGRPLLGIALSQDTFDRGEFDQFIAEHDMVVTQEPTNLPEHTELHAAVGIWRDGEYTRVAWRVDSRQMLFDSGVNAEATIKNLAIACIGYINCENVTLERQQVDAKINRKRAAKGKRLIEEYYLCRLRGVNYEAGEPGESTGRHVGFRFDVMGHFRRLASGRTTWIRAHQRGLQHEKYIPKVYEVE